MNEIGFEEDQFTLSELPYVSIQGEADFVGYPMLFVRIQGCPVGCAWCDSYYTWKPFNQENVPKDIIADPKKYSFKEFHKIVEDSKAMHVWFTGGEPTMQAKAIANYLKKYRDGTKLYHICTAGWVWSRELYERLDTITIDIKPPSSMTMSQNKVIDKIVDEFGDKVYFKMVVANQEDDKAFAIRKIEEYAEYSFTLQPLYISEPELRKATQINGMPDVTLSNWRIPDFADWICNTFHDTPFIRMGLQLHKHIWPERQRGI